MLKDLASEGLLHSTDMVKYACIYSVDFVMNVLEIMLRVARGSLAIDTLPVTRASCVRDPAEAYLLPSMFLCMFSLATVLLCESKLIEGRAFKLARASATCAPCIEKTYGNPRACAVPF